MAFIVVKLRAKGLLHGGGGAGQADQAAFGAAFGHGQAMGFRESFDCGDIIGMFGAACGMQGGAVGGALRRLVGGAEIEADGDALISGHAPGGAHIPGRIAMASGEGWVCSAMVFLLIRCSEES
jgi:hypothetical protein